MAQDACMRRAKVPLVNEKARLLCKKLREFGAGKPVDAQVLPSMQLAQQQAATACQQQLVS